MGPGGTGGPWLNTQVREFLENSPVKSGSAVFGAGLKPLRKL